jgi:hypothetical protein
MFTVATVRSPVRFISHDTVILFFEDMGMRYVVVGCFGLVVAFVMLSLVVLFLTKNPHFEENVAVSFGEPYGALGSSDGALLIVEPREHPLLGPVIHEFSQRVPPDWVLYVAHGTENAEYARAATEGLDRRVVFLPLHVDNLSADQYNRLFKTPEFWHVIDAEHILVFQTDAMPCGRMLDTDRYQRFGYIGCAYGNEVGSTAPYWKPHSFYGVGGVSLRRKSFMLKCLARDKYRPSHGAEDVAFSDCVDELRTSYRRPTAQDVGDFCAQSGWGDPSKAPRSYAAHQVGLMDAGMRQKFLAYCPTATQIS